LPSDDNEKHSLFQEWLTRESENSCNSALSQLKPRALEVFQYAVELKGVFSPSDYEAFGFNSTQTMRPHVKDLEDTGLLVSTQDDGDKRRKTIQITPKGWLVNYALEERRRRQLSLNINTETLILDNLENDLVTTSKMDQGENDPPSD